MERLNSYFYDLGNKGKTEWPIWVAGLCVIIAALSFVPKILLQITGRVLSSHTNNVLYGYQKNGLLDEFLYETYTYLPYILLLTAALYFVQKHLRKRPLKELITSAHAFQWASFWRAAFVYTLVMSCMWFIKGFFVHTTPETKGLEWVFNKDLLWMWPIVTLFIIVFTIAQEALFRGYITQGLSKFIKAPVLAFAVSSALYALSFVFTIGMMFGWQAYLSSLFVYGMAMCIITSMSNGLEAAIGIGVVNGLIYTLFVSSYGLDPNEQLISLYSDGTLHYDAVYFFIELAVLITTAVALSYLLPQTRSKPTESKKDT